jgi:hypothetical protein
MITGGLVFVSGQLPARVGGTSLADNKQVFNR